MTEDRVREIVDERMGSWSRRMYGLHATPLLLISVGHDDTSGDLHLMVPEGVPIENVMQVLGSALHLLADGTAAPESGSMRINPAAHPGAGPKGRPR